jgi:hypothetical protein
MSIDLCEHNLPSRCCEICRDLVGERTKKPDDVLISREWLTELIRDAHRYRFVKRGNSTHSLCGIWVPSPTYGGHDDFPHHDDVNAIVDAGMERKEWK